MQLPPNLSPPWSSRTKRMVGLAAMVLACLAVWWLAAILPILITASVLAYLFYPLATFIENRFLNIGPLRRIQSRGLAVLLAFLVVIMCFVVVILVIVPTVVGQLEEFGRNIPAILKDLETEVENFLSKPVLFNGEPILLEGKPFVPLERLLEATGTKNLDDLLQFNNFDLVGASQTFLDSLGSVTGPAFGFLGDAVNVLVNLTFLIVMMFYLMKDGEVFARQLVTIAPDEYRGDVRLLLNELARVWNAYLRGQLLIALLTGGFIFMAGLFLGLRNALVLGIFSGVLQLIPSIGPFLAIIPAAFIALVSTSLTFPFLQGLPFATVVVIVWVVIQNFILFIMTPRMMGKTLHLHPLVVILAVIGGASVAGVLGLILSAPFVASARVLAQYFYGKLTDKEPFPLLVEDKVDMGPPFWRRMGVFVGQHLPARWRAHFLNSNIVPMLFKNKKEQAS